MTSKGLVRMDQSAIGGVIGKRSLSVATVLSSMKGETEADVRGQGTGQGRQTDTDERR